MQHPDQLYGYSIVLLSAAPFASQLAISDIRWVLFFPIFAIPAIGLMLNVGNLSKSAVVQTFRKLSPITAGIGWALTWHVAERLLVEILRASQLFMYILFSIRFSLSWAVSCEHRYNSEYCVPINDLNISVTDQDNHYPDNFWPAQEFNRYVLRGNQPIEKMPAKWEPNMWYLGPIEDDFYFTVPSIHLLAAHTLIWTFIFIVFTKYYEHLGAIVTKVFVAIPVVLYFCVTIGLTVFAFHFTPGKSIQKELDDKKINEDPYDFWADLKGSFRTSLLIVDYSSAFTGFVLLATSRLRSGVAGLNVFLIVALLMVVPVLQTIIRLGCEGHVADVQPNYKIYASTDETISFDLLPVCFGISHFGSVWSLLYFTAQFLYSSLGPMIIYVSFIYQAFIDDFPIIQNSSRKFIASLCFLFAIPAAFLYMPMGTKITAFLRYTSESSFAQLTVYMIIYFVYGWHRLQSDMLLTLDISPRPTFIEYFTKPTSPIFSFLLFTIVPMFLCSKFVAVFDFLATGNDVITHVDAGVQFLPFSTTINRAIGYNTLFAPCFLTILGAGVTVYTMVIQHKLPLKDTLKPTSEWMAHASVNTRSSRSHSLANCMFTKILRISHRNAFFGLFLFETFLGIVLVTLFFLNSSSLMGLHSSRTSNDYRSCMLLLFILVHIYVLFDMRKNQSKRMIESTRLTTYIALATIETAMLNSYMWMFASDHQWGIDVPPLLIIFGNTLIRGFCIMVAIAIREHSINNHRPSNTREVSEIDEHEVSPEDNEDDSPVIFDLRSA